MMHVETECLMEHNHKLHVAIHFSVACVCVGL
jgi:hypothetical protein